MPPDESKNYWAVTDARFIFCIFLKFFWRSDHLSNMTHFSYEGGRSHVVSIAQLCPCWLDLSVSRHRGGGLIVCRLILDGKKKQLAGSLTTHDDHYFAIALLARKRSVNLNDFLVSSNLPKREPFLWQIFALAYKMRQIKKLKSIWYVW